MTIKNEDDKLALAYIAERGYASYSSLKNVRDCQPPGHFQALHFDIGTEVHSRWLEKKATDLIFSAENQSIIQGMVASLDRSVIATALLKGSAVEEEFHQDLNGLWVKGYIDIHQRKKWVADLKTLGHNSKQQFIDTMDFLQPALYMRVTGVKKFYYIGVSKLKPYNVYTFEVGQYPDRMKEANKQLSKLITYVKSKI